MNVEIREEVYIYSKIIPGAGGMPVGTNGSAMLLLSGGIDSPVAGYMIAKRGVEIEAVYFHAPPYTAREPNKRLWILQNSLHAMRTDHVCMLSTLPISSLLSTKNARMMS